VLEAQGWSVWWDPSIAPGEEFDRLIADELRRARAVVVVWTPTSVESRWVRGEARDGADRGILIPLRFEQATLPIDTRALHTIDLDAWDGTPDSPLLQPFLQAIAARLGSTRSLRSPAPVAWSPIGRMGASICVLPFVNMSGDPEQDYFSDGICEDVITDLSKVSALAVVSRNTAFTFKGKNVDLPQVARQLKVNYVLEGSVRRAGGRVRITAQLIEASSDNHLWAESTTGLNDIFALREISSHVTRSSSSCRRKKATSARTYPAHNLHQWPGITHQRHAQRRRKNDTVIRLCRGRSRMRLRASWACWQRRSAIVWEFRAKATTAMPRPRAPSNWTRTWPRHILRRQVCWLRMASTPRPRRKSGRR
jgi:TolB-like protein